MKEYVVNSMVTVSVQLTERDFKDAYETNKSLMDDGDYEGYLVEGMFADLAKLIESRADGRVEEFDSYTTADLYEDIEEYIESRRNS